MRFCLLLFFSAFVFLSSPLAQQSSYFPKVEHPEWYKVIPKIDVTTPLWVKALYEEGDNFEKVERLKSEYYRDHPWQKNIHTQNYKYWFKIVNAHVGDDGYVYMPKAGATFQKYEQRKRSLSRQKSSMDIWQNIGPTDTYNAGSNAEVRPTQANVYCMAVAPSNPSILYASMETGGVFKSTDKGLNWFPTTYNYGIGNGQDIKVDPTNPDIVYLCRDSELYRTTDGGNTWNLHYTASSRIEQIYIEPSNSSILYAATQNGLLKSTNSGSTWLNKYSAYVYDIEAKPGSTDTFYIAIKNDQTKRPEVFRSINAGDNWTLMDNGFYSPSDLTNATVYGCKLGVTPADPNRIYAGIIADGKAGDDGWIGIYYSLDHGVNWQNDSGVDGASIYNASTMEWEYPPGNDMNDNWYVAGYSSGYHQGWYNFDIDVSHQDPDRLWIGTIWFCESANKGGNIEYVRGTRNLSMHADIQDIDVVGSDIWVTSDGGINYSNDEFQTTEIRMSGITASDFWGFGHGWNEDTWIGGRYHNGNAAFHENYGIGNTVFLGGAEAGTGYVNKFYNRKTYTSDAGADEIPLSLQEAPKGIPNLGLFPNEGYYHFNYSEVEWHPVHTNIVYVGKNDQFHISEDGGFNFRASHTFPGSARRFEVSRKNPDYIYMIVEHDYWTWRVHKSTDGGESFTELAPPPYTSGSWRNLSLCLNPLDENEIWLASNSSNNGNKIFRSTDGGISWTNHYSAIIADEGIKDMIYQPSASGDQLYVLSNDGFFRYDLNTTTWTVYDSGLPVQHTGFMILPYFSNNKVRMASAKGIWEADLASTSKPQALIMTTKDTLYCQRDTAYFDSHSIMDAHNATYTWTFSPTPVYVDDLNIRNPKVIFGHGGGVDATLHITQADGQSDSITVNHVIYIDDQCQAERIAGKALDTRNNNDYAIAREANLSNVTHFTVTGWWKPSGAQEGFAALFSDGQWCAHCNNTVGLIYDYFASKLWYKWPGDGNSWGSNSGMDIPQDEWSYVALSIEPSKATLYLNDQKYVHNRTLFPADINNFYLGYGHYSKSFKGHIDEVSIWNRTLSEDEIYRLRHITKDQMVQSDSSLLAYYQFNALQNGSQIMDVAGTRHAVINNGADLVESLAPLGGGKSQIVDLSNNQYLYTFDSLSASIEISDCTFPEGKLVLSHIENAPYLLPPGQGAAEYYILNKYGTSQSIGQIEAFEVTARDTTFISGLSSGADAFIHHRGENNDLEDWTLQSYGSQLDQNQVTFDRKINLSSDGQFALSTGLRLEINDPGKPCEADTVPGKLLMLPGNGGDYAEIPALNLNTNTLTMSAWVKADRIQNVWAGILFCRGGNTVAGLSCASNNELRYHWNGAEYGWSSGAFLPVNEWSHVALVIEANSVSIYLNGVPFSRNTLHSPEEFDHAIRIGNDATSNDRTFDGEVDEVCIWNRALSQSELRSLRHLTKEDIIYSDPDLVAYYQFNEENGPIYDKSLSRLNASLMGNTGRLPSNTPVGGGVNQLLTIDAAGIYNSTTGLQLNFGSGGVYPNGEISISRINLSPDQKPSVHPGSQAYWIINNYGSNTTISGLDSIQFSKTGIIGSASSASDFNLYRRSANAHGASWTLASNTASLIDGSINFDGSSISSLGQWVVDNDQAKGWIGVNNHDWDNPLNWGGGQIPGSNDLVIIPKLVPYFPKVNIVTTIGELIIQKQAEIEIQEARSIQIED